ncbi:hypothetical protein DBR32_04880 [Taibaiella sp. KBW10]|uniref:hypothetical protein n=1 Tax=Taibaiella sp. KBW10 TaxID=2153357 RepID=UPI000F5A3987|nr:hypothetical protein [Taibaiella sp. KBW10]RQO31301.1 hypothetical protein DBR32_04880 [Taibaiella sp. KBW10]
MANKKSGGLLALGLAAAAYWIWGMKKEDKDKVKETVKNAGTKLKDKLPQDLRDKLDGFSSSKA